MNATDIKRYIFENDKIPFVLEDIGCDKIKYHPCKEYYSATQPDGDNPNGVIINNNEYLNYRSYSRGVSFSDKKDLIWFVQKIKEINFTAALKYLHDLLELSWDRTYRSKQDKPQDPLKIFKQYAIIHTDVNNIASEIDAQWDDELVPGVHIDFFREGITKKTINKFGLMYSYRYHRTVIPIKDWKTGRTLGFNARTSVKNYEELGISKYWITPGLNKSFNLYGLWENRETIEMEHRIVIYEAEKSVLRRYSLGDGTGVALSGHHLSSEQIRIILGLDINEVVIAMDKDVSLLQILYLAQSFYGLRKVTFIYDTKDLLKEKQSPADASIKKYNELFENRITYNEIWHSKYLKMIED